jgi:hypothetical protein
MISTTNNNDISRRMHNNSDTEKAAVQTLRRGDIPTTHTSHFKVKNGLVSTWVGSCIRAARPLDFKTKQLNQRAIERMNLI